MNTTEAHITTQEMDAEREHYCTRVIPTEKLRVMDADTAGLNAEGINERIRAQVGQAAPTGNGDGEIQQWSDFMAKRGPDSDAETMVFFTNRVSEYSKTRVDIKSFFELLDVDDHATFGGKA